MKINSKNRFNRKLVNKGQRLKKAGMNRKIIKMKKMTKLT